jgi:RsiW-degrading membrane proteinase PrsW (M82 family)
MKSLMDIVLVIVGLIALVFTVLQFYWFAAPPGPEGPKQHLWMAIGGAVVLCACALGLFLRHVNKEEEIHITQ